MIVKRRPLWAYIVAVVLIAMLAFIGNKGKQNAHHSSNQNSCIG